MEVFYWENYILHLFVGEKISSVSVIDTCNNLADKNENFVCD